MGDQIVDEIRRREQNTTNVGGLMGLVVEHLATPCARDSQNEAWLAWNRVNGDVERTHTSGVYVGEPRRGARDPELTVYVDSSSFMTDFSANHEVYLARLESVGLRFSRIEFRLSKRSAQKKDAAPARSRVEKAALPRELPSLLPDEEEEIEKLCSALPSNLRESVSQAMRVSIRAQKQEHS